MIVSDLACFLLWPPLEPISRLVQPHNLHSSFFTRLFLTSTILKMPSNKGLAISRESERSESSILSRFVTQVPFSVGSRERQCIHCGALRWGLERTAQNKKNDQDVYSNCCQQGDVTLPMSEFDGPLVPDEMRELFAGATPGTFCFVFLVFKLVPFLLNCLID